MNVAVSVHDSSQSDQGSLARAVKLNSVRRNERAESTGMCNDVDI